MNMLEALIASKMSGGSGGGSGGGGDKVLNSDGIIKQEHLPEGYPYVGEGYILPETTLVREGDASDLHLFAPVNITAGETYTVKWNGTDYSCETIAADMDGIPIVVFGDLGAMGGEPSGSHPFVVAAFPVDMIEEVGVGAVFTPLDDSTTATVSIKGNIVTKMDEKYLPSNIRTVVSVLVDSETGNAGVTADMNYSTIRPLVESGKDVLCKVRYSSSPTDYGFAYLDVVTDTTIFFQLHYADIRIQVSESGWSLAMA